MYYISNKKGYSELIKIEIESNGNFKNIPEEFEDFFSDDFREIMKLTEVNAKIKLKDIDLEGKL